MRLPLIKAVAWRAALDPLHAPHVKIKHESYFRESLGDDHTQAVRALDLLVADGAAGGAEPYGWASLRPFAAAPRHRRPFSGTV